MKKKKTKHNRTIPGMSSFAALEVRLTVNISPGTARSQGDDLRMVKDTQCAKWRLKQRYSDNCGALNGGNKNGSAIARLVAVVSCAKTEIHSFQQFMLQFVGESHAVFASRNATSTLPAWYALRPADRWN